MSMAQRAGCGSSSSMVRKRLHNASVMASVKITSGIRMRVKRNSPTLVASTMPEHKPQRRPRPEGSLHAPKRAVTQHSRTVESAMGIRAAQSCTPKIRNDTAIIQYLRGDFSR